MYLSRLSLDSRHKDARRDLADCGQMHRTVMAAFPATDGQPARQRFGVLFRVDILGGDRVVLHIQSTERPDWSHLKPGYLLSEPVCKPVARIYAALQEDMLLRFRLRANPTRKIDTKSDAQGGRRHGHRVELRSEPELIAWLQRKAAAGGFAILSVKVDPGVPDVIARTEGKVIRKRGSQAIWNGVAYRPLTFASVLFDGHLRITDAARFLTALENGVGPGKAYGFGLLSLARPSG